eukprot:TRINITY_DN67067_c0_g1_i1.p1 TRINITY_DN67067_c0_g1~~TRINITY_DN67067_c0_g1_i1.p1  ORF type:complete len:320 (-),score=55.87 TRINITY_DN67067_c0_g1_i1:70-1029(-)
MRSTLVVASLLGLGVFDINIGTATQLRRTDSAEPLMLNGSASGIAPRELALVGVVSANSAGSEEMLAKSSSATAAERLPYLRTPLVFPVEHSGPSDADNPRKVISCVGDSITWGLGTKKPETDGYPAQLQRMLGVNFEVKNFGYPGSCAMKDGDVPYATNSRFLDSLKSQADVFVLCLGTNDAKDHNWDKKEHFFPDYVDLIDQLFATGASMVLIMTPPPMYAPNPGSGGPAALSQLWQHTINMDVPMQVNMVSLFKALPPAIDIHGAFEAECANFSSDCPLLSHDGTHPSDLGYDRIAKQVYRALHEQPFLRNAFTTA